MSAIFTDIKDDVFITFKVDYELHVRTAMETVLDRQIGFWKHLPTCLLAATLETLNNDTATLLQHIVQLHWRWKLICLDVRKRERAWESSNVGTRNARA